MKLISIILLILVSTVACLDSTQPINPLNKSIEPYNSTFPEDLLINDKIILYKPQMTIVLPDYTNETLPYESDIVLYGTLKSIQPSIWSTEDQNPPSSLYDMQINKSTLDFENGTTIEYNSVTIPGCNSSIYTPVTFEVNNMVKGKNVTEFTVFIPSGQVDNYISMDSRYPLIWDLEIGQEYLIYLKNDVNFRNYGTEKNTKLNTIMGAGFFIVIE